MPKASPLRRLGWVRFRLDGPLGTAGRLDGDDGPVPARGVTGVFGTIVLPRSGGRSKR
jgi:hypothetical protein